MVPYVIYNLRDFVSMVPYAIYNLRDYVTMVPYAIYNLRDFKTMVPFAIYYWRDYFTVVPYVIYTLRDYVTMVPYVRGYCGLRPLSCVPTELDPRVQGFRLPNSQGQAALLQVLVGLLPEQLDKQEQVTHINQNTQQYVIDDVEVTQILR
jgi:hypothetical protein